MLIKDILYNANIKCDDNVDAHTQLIYLNTCINTLNLECVLKLPIVTYESVEVEYKVSEEEYANQVFGNLVSTYIAYYTKKTEGYNDNENPFYKDFLSQKMNFINNFFELIKPEYKIDKALNGKIDEGRVRQRLFLRKTRLW